MFENIWITIPLIFIIKKIILPNSFIKDRLEFFANSITKNYIKQKPPILNSSPLEEKGATDIEKLKKEEKIESLEQISLKKEKQNKENTYKTYAENFKKEKIEKVKIIKKPSKLSLAISKFFSENLLAKLG